MKFALVAVLSFLLTCCYSQSRKPERKMKFSASELKEDLKYLYSTLQAAHYNLFVYTDKAVFDRQFAKLNSEINDSLGILEAFKLFQRFASQSEIGHCRINFSTFFSQYNQYLNNAGLVFPMEVLIVDGRLIISNNYSGRQDIKIGDEIVGINGSSSEQVLQRMLQYVSGEGNYIKYSVIESFSFPGMYWLANGRHPSFTIKLKQKNGRKIDVKVNALTDATIQKSKQRAKPLIELKREIRFIGDIAYLFPGPFYNMSGGNDFSNAAVVRFLDSSFTEIRKRGSKALLVDLRNNPGGDNSFSDPLVAFFANKPFRFCSAFYLKTSDVLKDFWNSELPKSFGAQLPPEIKKMQQAIVSNPSGTTFEYPIMLYPPRIDSLRFDGSVYALVNRRSYSNATTTAALIQDYGFGKLVGEETSDLPTSYASVANFRLPNTGLIVDYPKGYFIRPSGDTSKQGVIPDHLIKIDRLSDQDQILEAALRLATKHTGAQK
jgi:hypothetical protein